MLKHDKLLWFQKSLSNWILKEDRNTRYFHSRTLARSRKNKIEGLKIEGEEWCFDSDVLEQHMVGFLRRFIIQILKSVKAFYVRENFLNCYCLRGKIFSFQFR